MPSGSSVPVPPVVALAEPPAMATLLAPAARPSAVATARRMVRDAGDDQVSTAAIHTACTPVLDDNALL